MDVVDYNHWTQGSKKKGSVCGIEVHPSKGEAQLVARAWRRDTVASVRTFHRDIRCDGLRIGVHVVVARNKE